jgi:DNA modification methylase
MTKIDAIWDHSYINDCIPNFSNNMEKPRHRWYDFKEGFSFSLVDRAIKETRKSSNKVDLTVLDPFSGSGTSPLSALQNNCNAIGFEINPFLSFVGKTKCSKLNGTVSDYRKELEYILSQQPTEIDSPLESYSTFTYSDENTDKWLFNKSVIRAFEALYSHISHVKNKCFFELALISAVMQCCNAKKDGKCLRYLKNWKNLNYNADSLRTLFVENALTMLSDLEANPLTEKERIIKQGDTRVLLNQTKDMSVDLVIFSPPYLNTFDYSDIYRPELFLGKFVSDNNELMKIRKQTLRSHVQCKWETMETSDSAWVKNLVDKLRERKDKLWNNDIPQMVSSYFYDMEIVLKESYRIANKNAQLWFVVSTSAYGGIEIPVDLILADIANKQGWELVSVNALRKLRTSSQCIDDNMQRVKLRESLIICRK